MEEFFINDYVVEIKGGHPGRTDYTVFSTRENMEVMVTELSNALRKSPENSSAVHSDELGLLWRHYATTAFGSTCRVSLAFRLADNLSAFHVRPNFVGRVRGWLRAACWLVFIVFAIVGFDAILSGFVSLTPFTEGLLIGIPLLGAAVGTLWLWDRVRWSRRRRP